MLYRVNFSSKQFLPCSWVKEPVLSHARWIGAV